MLLSSTNNSGIIYWYRDGNQLYRTANSKEAKYYYLDGQLAIQELYKNKKLEMCKKWHKNGQFRERSFYRNRELEGERKEWYENGHPYMQEFYQNGKCNGERTIWRQNGQIQFREFYRDGKREGECKYYWCNNEGTLSVHREFYQNGRFVRNFSYSEKRAVLRISRRFLNRIFHLDNNMLISDLAKIVARFT